jgi:hypothetical protein
VGTHTFAVKDTQEPLMHTHTHIHTHTRTHTTHLLVHGHYHINHKVEQCVHDLRVPQLPIRSIYALLSCVGGSSIVGGLRGLGLPGQRSAVVVLCVCDEDKQSVERVISEATGVSVMHTMYIHAMHTIKQTTKTNTLTHTLYTVDDHAHTEQDR